MNLQQSPRMQNLTRALDEVDAAVRGAQDLVPPVYGGPQRDGIIAVAEAIAGDLCNRCRSATERLKLIEQKALQSVAKAKGAMQDHVDACAVLEEEVRRIDAVIASLEEQFREGA